MLLLDLLNGKRECAKIHKLDKRALLPSTLQRSESKHFAWFLYCCYLLRVEDHSKKVKRRIHRDCFCKQSQAAKKNHDRTSETGDVNCIFGLREVE